ncbi:glycogen/starch synthase [Rhizobium sp. Leaf453]|uniref:glycogen/starch synthase n=1 Tax=Rhizobium sp. Leaf453 TaxID=1736380 RepID=UPI0012E3AE77|nr:glycogen/starch synthase [Rhizobium sp. Leaf453]
MAVIIPVLFYRDGGPYLDREGADYSDNWKCFAALSSAAAQIAANGLGGWRSDIVHLHDWQSGLAAAYLKAIGASVPVVLSVHNLAFQGQSCLKTFANFSCRVTSSRRKNSSTMGASVSLKLASPWQTPSRP